MEYLIVKWVHVLSSTILFGTGVGTAFYLFAISLGRDTRAVATITRYVVVADWIFTASTIVLQPLSGWYLMHLMGLTMEARWIAWSVALFALATACWLPVLWLQVRMRDVANAAATRGEPLPRRYWRYFAWWTALGFPALFAFLAVFYLMVAKPY
ncbi:DUF2269 domain-containing protein [Lysobacter sp. GX 14042]|uniref:DUF2269 family protein n=1 Tax=Lysobacter sp. GX 14042 TaxID=2907155 RepID=UPI001F1C24E9|nr:DUF2269 domain-containing protein [Lysobacter sp. GX 14042]MCE7031492.1 DUF2269 domain-containing protein [Lysobacter sp. GX 14042]